MAPIDDRDATRRRPEPAPMGPGGSGSGPAEVDHEHSDVNVGAIAKFVAGLGLVVVASLLLMSALFGYFSGRALRADPPTPALGVPAVTAPPEPRLQTSPVTDLRAFRKAEDDRLHGYGWVDKSAGVVRIPIERAIDLIVERGLPATPAEAPASPEPAGGPRAGAQAGAEKSAPKAPGAGTARPSQVNR